MSDHSHRKLKVLVALLNIFVFIKCCSVFQVQFPSKFPPIFGASSFFFLICFLFYGSPLYPKTAGITDKEVISLFSVMPLLASADCEEQALGFLAQKSP